MPLLFTIQIIQCTGHSDNYFKNCSKETKEGRLHNLRVTVKECFTASLCLNCSAKDETDHTVVVGCEQKHLLQGSNSVPNIYVH